MTGFVHNAEWFQHAVDYSLRVRSNKLVFILQLLKNCCYEVNRFDQKVRLIVFQWKYFNIP